MKKLLFLAITLFVQICYANDHRTDSLIAAYDALVSDATTYITARQQQIDSLRTNLDTPSYVLRIAELYMPYRTDSALYYYSHAIESSDQDVSTQASIRRIRLLASIGNFDAAFSERNRLGAIAENYRVMYYDAMYRLYNEASASAKLPLYASKYRTEAQAYADTLIQFCESHGLRPMEYYRQCITRANSHRDYQSALAYTDSAMNGVRKVEEFGNMGTVNAATFRLPDGNYTVGAQAVDGRRNGSTFTTAQFSIIDGEATAIAQPTVQGRTTHKAYTLTGQYIGTSTDNAARGIYIIDNKKIRVK